MHVTWTHIGGVCAAQDAEEPRVQVGVVLCHGPVHPVVLAQHFLVDVGVHAFPRPPCREGAPAPHVGVQHSVGVEVVLQEGAAF